MASGRFLLVLGSIVAVAPATSAVAPHDRVAGFMEVLPVLIAAPGLVATRARFPLTPLLYLLITVHALVLILGAEYTDARVPPGYRVQDALDLARNPHDRIGHFMQGLVPALVARAGTIGRSRGCGRDARDEHRGALDGQAAGYAATCSGFSIEFGGRDAFIDELHIAPGHRARARRVRNTA